MRSIPAGTIVGTPYITPHELNAEMEETVSVINALDRDNMPHPALLTSAKLRAGALGTISFHGTTALQTVDHVEGQSNTYYPVPDSAGAEWVISRPSRDGMLRITFFCTAHTAQALRIAIRINGRVYCAPWSNRQNGYDSQLLRFIAPVPSGTQLIEPIYAHSTAHEGSPIAAWQTHFYDRQVIVQELR
jgi:hypothetical protein